MYFACIQFLSYFFKQTSGEIPVVFEKKKKKKHWSRAFFFSNHLKSTKIKQSSFGKHQKLNIHIFTENHQNIPFCGSYALYYIVFMPPRQRVGGGHINLLLSEYRYMVCPAISSYSFGATALIFCMMFIHIMEGVHVHRILFYL